MGLRNFIFNTTGICLKKKSPPFLFSELYCKKYLLNKTKTIETIAIGSSHGAYSFIPSIIQRNSFNLCSTSQDLYYSYQLYKKVCSSQSKLKTIFLFYSVFSSGFEVEKTSEKSICAYFAHLYKISPKCISNEILLEIKKTKMYKKTVNFKKIDNGFLYREHEIVNVPNVDHRAFCHLRENQRINDQINYLIKLITDCETNDQQLVIVLPPARIDYKQLIPDDVFDKLIELRKQYNFKLIDYFNSDLFDDTDFIDCDHVNLNGAIKLSNNLKNYL